MFIILLPCAVSEKLATVQCFHTHVPDFGNNNRRTIFRGFSLQDSLSLPSSAKRLLRETSETDGRIFGCYVTPNAEIGREDMILSLFSCGVCVED